MNVVRLAFAYVRRRPLTTAFNVALLALGVATITLVILLSHELEQRLAREAAGIDLVVGAKGSPLQLVLAGIYHADVPPGNVPLAAVEELARRPLVRQVIPMALGDSYRGFRIVGTTPSFAAHYDATLEQGRAWTAPMEAVLAVRWRGQPASRLAVPSPDRTGWPKVAGTTTRRRIVSSACSLRPAVRSIGSC